MNTEDKIKLSETLAALYGVEACEWIPTHGNRSSQEWLADDTLRLEEMAVEARLTIQRYDTMVSAYSSWNVAGEAEDDCSEQHQDHDTKLEASNIAKAKALIKVKGGE